VFIGTSPFACPSLEAIAGQHDVRLVVTQPDRPVGRHADMTPPAVKRLAEQLDLPVYQPERINREEPVARLAEIEADAFVVAAYGQILKPAVFDLPRLGAINIHGSLLPAYRGAAPVRWAIIRGETITGVTTILIDAGMDTGDMLLSRSIEIGPDETAGELQQRLAKLAADVILDTLSGRERGEIEPAIQSEEDASLAPMLSRDDGRIDWSRPAQTIHNLVRGTNPWPGAWTSLGTERVKIHRSRLTGIARGAVEPGAIGPREDGRLLVGTGDDLIEIFEIQREGKARTSGAEFVNGLRGAAAFGN
jgi:methionyl-tRNA formyltransferase